MWGRPCSTGDCRGKSSIPLCGFSVRAGAKVVAIGSLPESISLDIPRLVLDGIQVVGSLVGTRKDLVETFQFAAEGKMTPKVALWQIEAINTIFDEMQAGKIQVEWSSILKIEQDLRQG